MATAAVLTDLHPATERAYRVWKDWSLIGGLHTVWHMKHGNDPRCTFWGDDAEFRAHAAGRAAAGQGDPLPLRHPHPLSADAPAPRDFSGEAA